MEQPVVNPAKIKGQVRTVREKRPLGPRTKSRKRRMRVLTSVALRQQVVGNVRVRGGAGVVDEWRAARMESPMNLRVEPVVALDRLRRRK